MPAIQLSLRRGATRGVLITMGALMVPPPFAGAQTESTTDSASPGEDESPSVANVEPTTTEDKKQNTTPAEPEPETQQQLPAAVSVEYVERKEPEPAETGVYSKKVQGKLWLEGFVGPSSYDPDRFDSGFEDLDVPIDAPKVKGLSSARRSVGC